MDATRMQAAAAAGELFGPQGVQPSQKSYTTAVVLSSLLGFIGLQHFYLGRWAEGLLDVALSIGWIVCFALDETLLGVLFVIADVAHAFVATILLLTGSYRDAEGRRVCYPGQKLNPGHTG
jgi:TM2 domain-containing membrane protein YozV